VQGRGASAFQAPTLVDSNIGEATGTYPSIALNRGGQGYLAYQVVTSSDANAALPDGYVTVDRRLARFNGQYWSGLGFSFARNTAAPVLRPTAGNSPQVVADTSGNGIVAWQEPDDDFVDRIWARRVFGTTLGIAKQVSPSKLDDKPLRGGADAFSLDTAGFGEGAIAFRQQPAQGSALTAPTDMIATIPETFAADATSFSAARAIDGGQGVATLGAPSVAVIASGDFLAGFGGDTKAFTAAGDDATVAPPVRYDAGTSSVAPDPLVDLAASGAGVVAFPVLAERRGGVEIHELRADKVPGQRTVSAAKGGQIVATRLAGSGFGDAIVGFQQGIGANTQIAASVVDAPPDAFGVQTPLDWVRTKRIPIQWDAAGHAIGGVTYTVTADDQTVATGLTGTTYTLGPKDTESGRQTIAVIATDQGGQETTSDPAVLKVDRTPPKVSVSGRGRTVTVRISDPQSGVNNASTRLRVGAGALLRGQTTWTLHLTKGGRYRAKVKAKDMAGNRSYVSEPVRVK
jgi:hypothetical protein